MNNRSGNNLLTASPQIVGSRQYCVPLTIGWLAPDSPPALSKPKCGIVSWNNMDHIKCRQFSHNQHGQKYRKCSDCGPARPWLWTPEPINSPPFHEAMIWYNLMDLHQFFAMDKIPRSLAQTSLHPLLIQYPWIAAVDSLDCLASRMPITPRGRHPPLLADTPHCCSLFAMQPDAASSAGSATLELNAATIGTFRASWTGGSAASIHQQQCCRLNIRGLWCFRPCQAGSLFQNVFAEAEGFADVCTTSPEWS